MFKFLARLFRPRASLGPEAIQSAFREHYRNFRALLTANNNALELMSEAEEVLQSGKPFGMAFVRGELTALTVNVYKMVHSLVALSDGRYRDLHERFRVITGTIEAILARQPEVAGGALVLTLEEIDRRAVDQVGEKMANLGEVRNRLGLRVPEGFAITTAAARHFLESSRIQNEINRRLKILDIDDLEALYNASSAIQDLIRAAPLPAELAQLIGEHYRRLAERAGGRVQVSLRSSARGEDSMQGSFAGQYRTRLRVDADEVTAAYKDVVAGKYQSQAIVYRQQRGYRHQDVLMSVGCLVMVEAAASGVSYSRPPDDARGEWVVIHAARGIGTRVVSGTSAYEMARVGREPPHEVIEHRLADRRSGACLSPGQLREIAQVSIRIENHFGSPQDIEWAYDAQGRLFILQCRPAISRSRRCSPAVSRRAAASRPDRCSRSRARSTCCSFRSAR